LKSISYYISDPEGQPALAVTSNPMVLFNPGIQIRENMLDVTYTISISSTNSNHNHCNNIKFNISKIGKVYLLQFFKMKLHPVSTHVWYIIFFINVFVIQSPQKVNTGTLQL